MVAITNARTFAPLREHRMFVIDGNHKLVEHPSTKRVCFSRNKFAATINAQGKSSHLGYFDSEVEAALAYDAAARKHFGEFAAVNFPQLGEQGAVRSIDDTPEGEEP
jgi:AP2 domain